MLKFNYFFLVVPYKVLNIILDFTGPKQGSAPDHMTLYACYMFFYYFLVDIRWYRSV